MKKRWNIATLLFFTVILLTATSALHIKAQGQNYLGDATINDEYPSSISRGYNNFSYHLPVIDSIANIAAYFNTATGTLFLKRSDFITTDILLPINLEFTYNSASTFNGRYGKAWQLNHNLRYVRNDQNNNILVIRGDDRSDLFIEKGGKYFLQDGSHSQLKKENGIFILTETRNSKTHNKIEYYFGSPQHQYLTKIIDHAGNIITFKYNENKELSSIEYPTDRKLYFLYDNNKLQAISFDSTEIVQFQYQGDLLTKAIYPTGKYFEYSYDDCNKLSSITTSDERTFSFQYDEEEQFLNKLTYPENIALNIEKDNDSTFSVNLANQAKYKFVHDTLYRTSKIIKPDGGIYSYNWSERNNLTKFQNPLGGITSIEYEYDSNYGGEEITSIINPLGGERSFSYQDQQHGKYKQYADKGGVIYKLSSDANDKTIEYPNGQQTSITENIKGNPVALSIAENNYIDMGYDYSYNIKRISYNANIQAFFKYDDYGNIISYEDPEGNRYSMEYAAQLISKIIYPDSSEIVFDYDAFGKIQQIKKNNTVIESYLYDELDRIQTIALNGTYNFDYDDYNYSIDINAYNSPYESIKYNSLLMPIEKKYATNSQEELTYDQAGNMTASKNIYGLTTTFDYNNANLLTNQKEQRDTYYTYYTYSEFGLLTKIENDVSKTEINYDAFNNPIKTLCDDILTTEKKYNLFGKPTQLKENGITYLLYYDNISRLTSQGEENMFREYFNYNKNSILTLHQSKDGYIVNYILDKKNRVIEKKLPLQYSIYYTYDKNDNILTLDDNLEDDKKRTYTYNNENNIIESISPMGVSNKYEYISANNCPIRSYLNDGLQYELSFTPGGRIANIAKENAKRSYFEYTQTGDLQKYSNDNALNLYFTYNNARSLEKVAITDEYAITIENDGWANIATIKDTEGRRLNFTFDKQNLDKIVHNGNTTTYLFDNEGKCLSINFPNGLHNQYKYNKYGKLIAITDNRNDTIQYAYDDIQRISQTISACGTIDYTNQYGNITQIRDQENNSTHFMFYNDGRLYKKMGAEYTLEYKYNADLQLESIQTEKQQLLAVEYSLYGYPNKIRFGNYNYTNSFDQFGNNLTKGLASDKQISTSYNLFNQKIDKRDERINHIEYKYDFLGRCTQYGTFKTSTMFLKYDNQSNIIKKTNAIGLETVYKYDTNNNLSTILLSKKDSVTISRKNDQIATIKNTMGAITEFQYLQNGLLSTIKNLDRHDYNFAKSANSLMITSSTGQKYIYGFDEKLRTSSIIQTKPARKYNFTYTATGNIAATSGSENYQYTYDMFGQRKAISSDKSKEQYFLNNTNVVSYVINNQTYQVNYDEIKRISGLFQKRQDTTHYSYYDNGAISNILAPDKNIIAYIRNKDNHLRGISVNNQDILYINTDAEGQVESFIKNNIMEDQYIYNNLYSLAKNTYFTTNTYQYLFNSENQILSRLFNDKPDFNISYKNASIDSISSANINLGINQNKHRYNNYLSQINTLYAINDSSNYIEINYKGKFTKRYTENTDAYGKIKNIDICGLNVMFDTNSAQINSQRIMMQHDSIARTSRKEFPNGVIQTYQYKDKNTVKMQVKKNGTLIYNITYSCNDAQQAVFLNINDEIIYDYQYDKNAFLNRIALQQDTNYVIKHYINDYYGNRLREITETYSHYPFDEKRDTIRFDTINYTYVLGERLSQFDSIAVQHDARGNISHFGSDTFKYDNLGNILSLTQAGKDQKSEYNLAYNGLMQISALNDSLYYFYDNGKILAIFDSTGNALYRFVYTDDAQQKLLAYEKEGKNTHYIHTFDNSPFLIMSNDSGDFQIINQSAILNDNLGNLPQNAFPLSANGMLSLPASKYCLDNGRLYNEQTGQYHQPTPDYYGSNLSRYAYSTKNADKNNEQANYRNETAMQQHIELEEFYNLRDPLGEPMLHSNQNSIIQDSIRAFFNRPLNNLIATDIRLDVEITDENAEVKFAPNLPEQFFDSLIYHQIKKKYNAKPLPRIVAQTDKLQKIIDLLRFVHGDTNHNVAYLRFIKKQIDLSNPDIDLNYFPTLPVLFKPDIAPILATKPENNANQVYLDCFDVWKTSKAISQENIDLIYELIRSDEIQVAYNTKDNTQRTSSIYDITFAKYLPNFDYLYQIGRSDMYDNIQNINQANTQKLLENIFGIEHYQHLPISLPAQINPEPHFLTPKLNIRRYYPTNYQGADCK